MRMVTWEEVEDVMNDFTPVGLNEMPGDILSKVDAEIQAFGLQLVFCGSVADGRAGWFKVERLLDVEPHQTALDLAPRPDGLHERDRSSD